MTGYQKRRLAGRLALHAVLLSIGVLFMLPFIWSISTSLKSMGELFSVQPNLIQEIPLG